MSKAQPDDVPLPPCAELWDAELGHWFDDEPPRPRYRFIRTRTRAVGDVASVFGTGIQYADGQIDLDDPPTIRIELCTDDGVTLEQARELADRLREVSLEVEVWAAAHDASEVLR